MARRSPKFNYGKYWFNPGADFVFNVSENTSAWWTRYRWNDVNNNGRWEPGEEGTLVDRRGGVAAESIDPNLEDTRTDEIAAFLERELIPNFGVRAGYVWRGRSQPIRSASTRPTLLRVHGSCDGRDPGPDGSVATTGDDGPPIARSISQRSSAAGRRST